VQTPSGTGQRAQAPAAQTRPATLDGTQGRSQGRTGYAGCLDSGSYQQLEQDRQARTFGER